MADFISVTISIVDSENKTFKGFPFKGKFSNETEQKQKICDQNGMCKLTLRVGTTYHISVLKPDDRYQEKLVINATPDLNNSTQKIVLDHPINAYLTNLIITAKDLSSPPQVVPKAQLQISYMGRTSIRNMDDSGVLKLRILIGEPLQFQLIDPLSKIPMQGTHIDEITAKKMKNSIIVIQPSSRADSSLEPDKPNTTTPKTPESDMTITMEQMKKMFERAASTKMQPILDELNNNLEAYKLDTRLRQAHFMAQVREEIGAKFTLRENLMNYSAAGLMKNIYYYKNRAKEAEIDAAIKDPNLKEKTIANKGYMDVNKTKNSRLGNIHEGDGYKFIGRGLKMTTGREHYTTLTKTHPKLWSDEKVDFIENPELLETPKYATRAAIVFWLHQKIYTVADQGATADIVDKVTKIMNRYTGSYPQRRAHFEKAKTIFTGGEAKK